MRLGLLLLMLAIAVLMVIWFNFRGRRQQKLLSTGKITNLHLQPKLNRILSGDSTTALRLVKQAKIKYPGKSETWYWEKVIEDLERDRPLGRWALPNRR